MPNATSSLAKTLVEGACLVGLVHAAFSLYWAVGGRWLLETVGQWALALATQQPRAVFWLLLAAAAFKAAAIVPLLNARRKLPRPQLWQTISWLGGPLLILYGGLNTVVAWGVLLGAVPANNVDRAGLIGHAALWDPLFLIWGFALTGYLVLTRERPNQKR